MQVMILIISLLLLYSCYVVLFQAVDYIRWSPQVPAVVWEYLCDDKGDDNKKLVCIEMNELVREALLLIKSFPYLCHCLEACSRKILRIILFYFIFKRTDKQGECICFFLFVVLFC